MGEQNPLREAPAGAVHVIWITAGLSCDGDTVAVTARRSRASRTS